MEQRIKQIRKKFHLTQSEFGAQIGIKGNTVTNYENALRKPSNAVIASICRTFGVNERWLRLGEGDPYVESLSDIQTQINAISSYFAADDLIEDILCIYLSLSTESRAAMKTLIHEAAKGKSIDDIVNPISDP